MLDSELMRLEALDRAVRISLATGGHDRDSAVVARAETFLDFLSGARKKN